MTPRKRKLIAETRGCKEVIKPYLRGQDIGRWIADWAGSVDDCPALQREPSIGRGYPGVTRPQPFKAQYPQPASPPEAEVEGAVARAQDQGAYLVGAAVLRLLGGVREAEDHLPGDTRCTRLMASGYQEDAVEQHDVSYPQLGRLWLLAVPNSPLMWWYNWR